LNGLFKNVSIYTLNRNLQTLVNLKWIIRRGRGIRTDYYINPFLVVIWDNDKDSCYSLLQYTIFKIDFFNLLNLPLLNIVKSGRKIIDVKIEFTELHGHALWVRAFLNGILSVTFTFEDRTRNEVYYPVNLHAQPKIEWTIKNGKKVRSTNPYGIKHYCIPMLWELFDIQEAKMFSKTRRQSRYDKNLGEMEFIHFDNSFKIFHYPDTQRYLMFTKPFDIALKKWNNKNCQYIEFCNFKTLQKLLTHRFVDGKRRKDLFDALGLKYKPISGRPKSS